VTVRVRFAPSPTGSLHIGSVRTTLYNYFFAKHNQGALILRVEDTDQDRLVEGAIDSIYDGLHWLGINWDEGPREGGPHAPYIQSERLPLYQKAAQDLVDAGAAYFCFCSKERLAALRAQQQARGEITRYDGLHRNMDPKEAAEKAKSESHVVRLKVPDDGVVGIDDLVYGRVEWPLKTIEDQVILKSDGYPTYHLAVVVDDHLMGITHILRGEDWLPSTPKHLLIWRAFGWEVPPHAHVPNVLGADNKKLAKRHGATKVEQFRADGYLPEAMINYLALIGWAPGTEEEIFSGDELVRKWRIEQVQKAGGKFDRDRLDWFNGVWIRRLSIDELLRRLDAFIPTDWDRDLLRRALPYVQERARTFVEMREQLAFLFSDALAYAPEALVPKGRDRAAAAEALVRAARGLRELPRFDHEAIEAVLRRNNEELGWKMRDSTHPVRVAVTGREAGPPLFESMELLGKEKSIARIDRALEALGRGAVNA